MAYTLFTPSRSGPLTAPPSGEGAGTESVDKRRPLIAIPA